MAQDLPRGSGSACRSSGSAFYGIVGIAFTIFSFYTAYFFWQEIFGGLISSLWNGGLGSRILLLLLALVFIGPLIRGLLTLGAERSTSV